MTPTTRIDITGLGEFSTFRLAQHCLNLKYYTLCQLHNCNYQVKCIIDGRINYIEYFFEESKEALSFDFKIDLNPDDNAPGGRNGD